MRSTPRNAGIFVFPKPINAPCTVIQIPKPTTEYVKMCNASTAMSPISGSCGLKSETKNSDDGTTAAIKRTALTALTMHPSKHERFAFSTLPEPMCILTIVVTAAAKQLGMLKHTVEILFAML